MQSWFPRALMLSGVLMLSQPATAQAATSLVSVDEGGAQANGHSTEPAASSTGRHVAFTSFAANLVVGDTNGHYDVFVRR
jgi:hypothetical protein